MSESQGNLTEINCAGVMRAFREAGKSPTGAITDTLRVLKLGREMAISHKILNIYIFFLKAHLITSI